MTFFSITTPTYNRAEKLKKVFQSLQSQTFKDFEWIIGDDGSTDNTEEIVNEFIKESSFPIKYYRFEHKGKHHVFNKIQRYMSGVWHAWIDSDDEFYSENSLEQLYNYINTISDKDYFTGVAGCFINQNDKIFPKFSEDYYDITKENFFEFLTSDPEKLNIYKIEKVSNINIFDTNDNGIIPFYPEIVAIAKEVLSNKNYCVRVYNIPIYKYYQGNHDCVSSIKNKLPDWYLNVDMANLFYEYDLERKYPEYIKILLNELGMGLCKEKGGKDTYNALKSDSAKKYFLYAALIRSFFKYLFLIDQKINKTVIYVFGIKITFRRNPKPKNEVIIG